MRTAIANPALLLLFAAVACGVEYRSALANDFSALVQAPARPARPAVAQPTRREIEAIQRKIQRAWILPAGGGDVRGLQVDLRVALDSDGTVLAVQTVDRARLADDELFRRAAESAEAAVRRASPLPIPRDKIQFFKQFVLRFAPPQA